MRVTKRQSRQCAGRSWITTPRGNGEDQGLELLHGSLVRGWRDGTARNRRGMTGHSRYAGHLNQVRSL
jgi:hypothetical protein